MHRRHGGVGLVAVIPFVLGPDAPEAAPEPAAPSRRDQRPAGRRGARAEGQVHFQDRDGRGGEDLDVSASRQEGRLSSVRIHDLRERSHHADAVAERIWAAFWRNGGTPLGQIRGGLDAMLKNEHSVPFALVAECGDAVCGTALVKRTTLPNGPALHRGWPRSGRRGMRRQGIAAALLDEGVRALARSGQRLYLNSLPALQPFYTGLGWRIVEGVGAHRLTVYERPTSRSALNQ